MGGMGGEARNGERREETVEVHGGRKMRISGGARRMGISMIVMVWLRSDGSVCVWSSGSRRRFHRS